MQIDGDNNTDNIRTAGALPAATFSPTETAANLLKEAVEMRRVARQLILADMRYMGDRINASAEHIEAIASRLCSESYTDH